MQHVILQHPVKNTKNYESELPQILEKYNNLTLIKTNTPQIDKTKSPKKPTLIEHKQVDRKSTPFERHASGAYDSSYTQSTIMINLTQNIVEKKRQPKEKIKRKEPGSSRNNQTRMFEHEVQIN